MDDYISHIQRPSYIDTRWNECRSFEIIGPKVREHKYPIQIQHKNVCSNAGQLRHVPITLGIHLFFILRTDRWTIVQICLQHGYRKTTLRTNSLGPFV